ncbi:MAG: CDP-glycerol glycerophosphotransferase family protein, partial [bacterium]|nr:CDP-glycerol glycerophosphotransferase family protein [bacterium]
RTHPLAKDKIDISNLKNILDITYGADDIQEILIHTDILVVDYSSLIFDFALSKKSIIFYPFDYMDYIAHSRNMYFDYYKEMPGPFANNEKELLSLIEAEDVWSKEKDYKKKYEEFNGRFNKYQDGKSSGRLYKLLNSLI